MGNHLAAKRRLWARSALVGAAAVTAAAALPALAAAAPGSAAFASVNPVTPLSAASFAAPQQNGMPWVRWNFPPATATIPELETELQDMYDHHIAGVEIGQGGVPTNAQLVAVLNKANQLGIKVSLKASATTPTGTYAVDDTYARRTLAANKSVVDGGGTFNAALPKALGTNVTGGIIAVVAYKCSANPCPATGMIDVDRSSAQVLTDRIVPTGASTTYLGGPTDATLNWTAPAGGQWVLLTVRTVSFARMPEIMSRQGTDQLIASYTSYFAQDGIGNLLRSNGGDLFVDSHATDPWGLPQELWSTNMAAEFKARTGYDLVPNIAALFDATNSNRIGTLSTPNYFSFSDGSARRVRSDHNQVRTDLFLENRIEPVKQWLKPYNLQLRVQPEDASPQSSVDQIQAANAIVRPEHESLSGGDQTDVFRPIASANHMNGNTWYSTECCAARELAYVQTTQDHLIRMNHEFAGGVTKVVYHIYPYTDNPLATWPGMGFSAGSKVGFSNAWNRTQPYWPDVTRQNAYYSRTEQVLTQGDAKMDVAVYMHNYSFPQPWGEFTANGWGINNHRFWKDLTLQQTGYTWDYLDETLLNLPNAIVSNGRLAEDGPGYKAFIYDGTQGPVTNTAQGTLTLDGARKILALARAGLPVIFVGALPTRTPGLTPADDATLQALVAQIVAERSVVQVATEADVPAKLAALGINPQSKPAQPTTLMSVRRSDAAAKTDYYWLYNQGVDQVPPTTGVLDGTPENVFEEPAACSRVVTGGNPCTATGAPVDTTVTLEGKGVPFTLDSWTGKITPIANYSDDGSHVTVRVKLARDETTVIGVTGDPARFGLAPIPVHATSTTADSAAYGASGSIAIRASRPGTYTTGLSNGKTVTTTVSDVPAALDLTNANWHLSALDWQPANPYTTLGTAATQTNKVPVDVDLNRLVPWTNIPALANASGDGTYTTTVNLPGNWDAGYGAVLSLGQVVDSFTLNVNGTSVPIDQVSATADVGPYLRAGANTIAVHVATTYNNRLAVLDNAVRTRGVVQNYGLVGPVTLTPYAQRAVYAETSTGGNVGGTVPATLSLALGTPASFGGFTPGVDKSYDASTTATVISTAGDATLSVTDPSSTATGRLINGAFSLSEPLQAKANAGAFAPLATTAGTPLTLLSYAGPVSNDAVTVGFRQHIAANQPLRTGAYSKTLTFTLSTTTP